MVTQTSVSKIAKDQLSAKVAWLSTYKYRDAIFVASMLLTLYLFGYSQSQEFIGKEYQILSVVAFKAFISYIFQYTDVFIQGVTTWGSKIFLSMVYLLSTVSTLFFFFHMDDGFEMRIKGRKQWMRVISLAILTFYCYDVYLSFPTL